MEVERFDLKPQKVEVKDVKDVPLFATIKLKKVAAQPKKVTDKPKVPKVLLKSRIKIMPAASLVKHLVVTQLEPIFVDNGIISRNYEEAKKVRKTKRRKVLPQKPESVLEKFVPFVDEPKQPIEEQPSPKPMPEPKPEHVLPEEEKLKLVMGKGKKLPEEESPEMKFRKKQGELPKEEPEEVKLKPWKKDQPEKDVEEDNEPELQQPQPEDSKERRKKLKLPLKKSEEITEGTLKVKKVQFELQQPVSPLPPRFIERIQPVISEEEQPVLFSCVFEGFPKPSITWSHNGQEIQVTDELTVTVVENVATLRITKVKKSDVGTYSCRASNPAGVATCTANLVIIEKQEAGEPPKFVKPLKPKIAKKGTLTELECTVTGLPTPQVTWYRANEEIVPDRLHNVTFSPDTGKSVLTIVETTEIDEEIYAVRAVNKFGKAECRANLVLSNVPEEKVPEKLTPPKITKPLQAQVVPKEAPVTLEAEFTGSPKLTVKWFRNGKEIETTEEDEEIVEEETRTILRIKKTTKKKTGKYEVRVTNKVGEARTSCTVKTIDIEEMEEMKKVRAPRFIKPLKPTFVCEGEVVVMETLVESFPTCSFQWFIRDAPVTTRPDVRVSSEDNKSILVIEKITIEDTGEITCRAENVAGSVTSTASLQVGPESEVTELLSPSFLIKPQTAKVMDGESVLFTAKVVGQPTPQVKWFHNDKPIKEGKDKTIKQDEEGVCNLAIVEVFPEDSGVYTCVATNIAGEAIAATTLSVEAYEYVPDSEMATVTEVESSTLLSVRSESEEDLLGDKEMTTEAPEEFRTAPTFVTPLPQLVQATPGTILRMLVKAEGTPQPTIHWYKQGTELQPSEEFIIENLDDGTSILTIPEIYPDDAGEIVCEAHNELGVTQTVAYIDLPEIMGTSLYKKPEWVVHMEEMQEKIKATQAEPTFVKEITDSHVKTEETVVFDALYAGNPQPVIIWYHDDKILRASENVEISISDTRTTVVIKRVKSEDAGTYTCKASSNIGEVISKAKINIIGYGEVQEEEVEQIQEETVHVEKKEKKKKKRVKKIVTEEIERDSVDIEEVQPLESTVPFTETTETATAQRTFDIQESVAVSAVASCKKVSDKEEFPTDVPDVAGVVAPIQESVTITETIPGDEVVEMKVTKESTETAKITKSEQRSVSVSQTVAQSTVSELITESRTETQATESTEVLQTAKASRTTVSVSDIEETLEGLNVKEFGPWQAPLRELAKVDVLRKKGVSVEEVLTLYDTGELPALKTAPAQSALVSLVERVGHSSLISEMVTQEETLEGTLKGVLKAFLTMVDLRHTTVQETIPLFRVRDFQTPHWETVSTMPVIAEETATETITETSQVEVQGTE
uniref:Titin n=3 Tax=Lygus hesperus TaxID=30085 RepID=A0A0A9YTN9_LYGHE